MQWIEAFYPLGGIGVSLLVISGFRHSHQAIDWRVVIAVFFLFSFAMSWNNYHDRQVDVAKGHFLASRDPNYFLLFAMMFATTSLLLCMYVACRTPLFGMLCLAMWMACMIHPMMKTNPVGKNLIVSLTISATLLFPLLVNGKMLEPWLRAGSIFVIITLREFMKDVEDLEVDKGTKYTLPMKMNSHIPKRAAILLRYFLTLLFVVLLF